MLLLFLTVESRQYEEDYLIALIESENVEEVGYFFTNHPHYVKKLSHVLEFADVFRTKLGEKFGYTPTWREVYDTYKDCMSGIDMPQADKDRIRDLLKAVVSKTEKNEKGSFRCSAFSFDYKGDLEVDDSISEPVAIATTEVIAGVLLMILDWAPAQVVGGWMIADAASRVVDHGIAQGNARVKQPEVADPQTSWEPPYEPDHDRDSWDRDY